MPLLETIFPCK